MALSAAAASRLRSDLDDRENDIRKLKGSIDQLEADLSRSQRTLKEAEGKLSKSSIEIDSQSKIIKSLRETNARLSREIEDRDAEDDAAFERMDLFRRDGEVATSLLANVPTWFESLLNQLDYLHTEREETIWMSCCGTMGGQTMGMIAAPMNSINNNNNNTNDVLISTQRLAAHESTNRLAVFSEWSSTNLTLMNALRDGRETLMLSNETSRRRAAEQEVSYAMSQERLARDEAVKEVVSLREQLTQLERGKADWIRAMPEQDRLIRQLTQERDDLERKLLSFTSQSREAHRCEEVEIARTLERERELKSERVRLLENTSKLEATLRDAHEELSDLRAQLHNSEKEKTNIISKAHRVKTKYTEQLSKLKSFEKDGERAREILETEMAELRWSRVRANEALQRETVQLRAEWEGHVAQLERRVTELQNTLMEKDKQLTYTSLELSAFKERDRYMQGMVAPPHHHNNNNNNNIFDVSMTTSGNNTTYMPPPQPLHQTSATKPSYNNNNNNNNNRVHNIGTPFAVKSPQRASAPSATPHGRF
eukprot:PhM_4_TR10047/c0_g1_i1/m.65758